MNKEAKAIVDYLEEEREAIRTLCYYPDDVLNCEDLIMVMDYIKQLENLLSRETNRKEIATYDNAQLDKQLDLYKSVFGEIKEYMKTLCDEYADKDYDIKEKVFTTIYQKLDKVGGSNE